MIRREGFAGRTAVVTGAGGGMGLQIASELLAAGAMVAGIDVKDRPKGLADALFHQGDVSDDRFVRQANGQRLRGDWPPRLSGECRRRAVVRARPLAHSRSSSRCGIG
jgi:NAD(P)-dependent dehydrogenase (short-subunit alcohol dehydrogenase family)